MEEMRYLEDESELEQSALEEVMEQVRLLEKTRSKIDEMKEALSEVEAIERHLSEDIIPQMFDQNGLSEVKLDNGVVVSVKENVKASIPKDPIRRKQALEWLSGQGGGSLITDEVILEDPTNSLIEELNNNGVSYNRDFNVNTQSLMAWFRERFGINKGTVATLDREEVPSFLNVYVYRKTTLK